MSTREQEDSSDSNESTEPCLKKMKCNLNTSESQMPETSSSLLEIGSVDNEPYFRGFDDQDVIISRSSFENIVNRIREIESPRNNDWLDELSEAVQARIQQMNRRGLVNEAIRTAIKEHGLKANLTEEEPCNSETKGEENVETNVEQEESTRKSPSESMEDFLNSALDVTFKTKGLGIQ